MIKEYKMKQRKRILAIACALTMIVPAVCLPVAACKSDDDTGINAPEATLQSIELDTKNAKLNFAYGEEFSSAGLVVTATLSDGTTQNIPLSQCTFSNVDMTTPGDRSVQVTYKGKRKSYIIHVAERVLPSINATSVFDITGENPAQSYKVEGEDIDTATPGAQPAGGEFIITSEGDISGGKYLANYGAKNNYFGFTFTAEREYTDVTLVFRVMNPTDGALGLGTNLVVHHNYESVVNPGDIDIANLAVLPARETVSEAEGEQPAVYSYKWEDRIVRGLTIPEGANTITFDIKGEGGDVVCLDYIEFLVGMPYEGNRLNLTGVGEVVKEFEDFNLEKIKIRDDIVNAHQLKPGEAFIETPEKNAENTSGGKSVGAVVAGTEISTLICVEDKATVELFLTAAYPASYRVKDHWEFYIDGVKLRSVEDKDIMKGDLNAGEWYEWQDTSLGMVDLEAGHHLFVAKVVSGSANFDCFKFNVKTYGSFLERVEGDLIIDLENNAETSFVLEAESLDNTDVITRKDFVNSLGSEHAYKVGDDDNASGGKRIYGFDKGSKFVFVVYASKDSKFDISLTGFAGRDITVGANISLSYGGSELVNPDDETNMKGTSLTAFNLADGVELTKGRHTFTLEVLQEGFDFDCITFTLADSAE